MEETSPFTDFELQLDQTAKYFLKEIAKWAYLISILGFVAIVILLLFGIFGDAIYLATRRTLPGMGGMLDSYGPFMAVFYVMAAAISFFPVYYLFRFASKTKAAFRNNDLEALTASLRYLKSHYKFLGIFALFIFALYGLQIVLTITGSLTAR